MFGITPINSGYTTVSAKAAAGAVGGTSNPKPPKPTFGLATASFHTQTPQVKPMTPRMEKNQTVGRRLDYFA